MKTGKIQVAIDRLGREILVSPDSLVIFNSPMYQVQYFNRSVEVIIGIGKDEIASLIMDESAWNTLKSGEEIHITKYDSSDNDNI